MILDEAHERDVNTDMLMLLLKRVLAQNPNIKLVVMSATINPELFQNYYPGAEALSIPGFTFPVKSYFLDEITQGEIHIILGVGKRELDYQYFQSYFSRCIKQTLHLYLPQTLLPVSEGSFGI